MLRIQTQNLCVKRSCNIYLFMESGLWILIEATPRKPIRSKRDVGSMGGKGKKSVQMKAERRQALYTQWPPKSTDARPNHLNLTGNICAKKLRNGLYGISVRKNASNSSKVTSIKHIKYCIPFDGTTFFGGRGGVHVIQHGGWFSQLSRQCLGMCQIPEIRIFFNSQTTQ